MQDLMTMNIHAPHGTAITAVHENGKVQNGWGSDKELIDEHVELDKVYHVDHTIVGDWETRVYLIEIPNVSFNSVNFKEV